MNVCFATYPTAFQQPGGGERVLVELSAALERGGNTVTQFDPWRTDLTCFDVVHYFSSYGSELFPALRRYAHRLAVTPFVWPALPVAVALRRRLRRMMAPLAGAAPSPFATVDVLFPTSRIEAELLIRNYRADRARIMIVPHGADRQFAEPPSGEFAREHGLERYVLCPGRIDANKNQLRVVRALAATEMTLVVLGDPLTGADAYYSACRAAAGPRTIFVPSLPHNSESLRDAIAGASCVVIASHYELCSVAALEAGVAGVPIASTTGGGMVEHLAPWASFFDPNDERELRSAVLDAVQRPRSSEQSAHFLSAFSWDEIAAQTVRGYEVALRR